MKRKLTLIITLWLLGITGHSQQPANRKMVLPSTTDAAIDTFDLPHGVYFNNSAKSKNKLVVFIPGTNGNGNGAKRFSQVAADEGFHALVLSYPSSIPATSCRTENDDNCFENFRREIIEGKDLSNLIQVNQANSIENRLQKLLSYLNKNFVNEKWGQFLTETGDINWEKLILAGQSQGGGHAPLIAKYHKVSRVIMFGGPKDYDKNNNKPAKWYSEGATPLKNYFTFNHKQDLQGCTFPQQLEILEMLGLNKFGDPVDIDKTKPPFNNSRILITDYPGSTVTSLVAHTSVMGDSRTPLDKDGIPLFKPVWIYMLMAE